MEPSTKRQVKLAYLELQQDQREVIGVLGVPDRVRAANRRKDGKLVKVWEYEIYGNYRAVVNGLMCPITLFVTCFWAGNSGTPYWMQFVDGKLERWGKAGDWQVDQIKQDITIHNNDAIPAR